MQKEFVEYELALKMKELGFDEPCFGYYNMKKKFNMGDYTTKHWKSTCLAPLYQSAFKWFREKYKLQHHIWSGKINSIFYGYDILNIEEQEFVVNNSDIGGGDCDYYTYEEAELVCLEKLLEIVESKKE